MKEFVVGILVAAGLSGPAVAQTYSEMTDARDALVAGDIETAFAVIEPAAEAGHPRALNLLGAAYKDGIGVAQDAVRARDLFEEAAKSGYGPALFNLGLLYSTGGPGLAADLDLARDWHLKGVEADYPASMGAFAQFMLREGRMDEWPLILDALERGVVLGDPKSLVILGILTRRGDVVDADPERARDLLHAAALLRERQAQAALAEMMETGEGGPEDEVGSRSCSGAA